MELLQNLKNGAKALKRKVVMLWFATQHPQTPWLPKVICIFVVAYALSPIDLIPDFIPILGFLDDVILLPALIWIALHLIPEHVIEESTLKSDEWWSTHSQKPQSKLGLFLVLVIWLICAVGLYVFFNNSKLFD